MLANTNKKSLSLSWSLIDQGAISATNFLTIFLGAYFLDVEEQAKIAFFYIFIIATTLFNAAFYFASAPFLKNKWKNDPAYFTSLKYVNLRLSAPVAFVITLASFFASDLPKWEMGWIDVALIFFNIIFFQCFDFYRRSHYLFGSTSHAANSSLLNGTLRLSLIFLYTPSSATQFLIIILFSSVFSLIPSWIVANKKGVFDSSLIKEHVFYSRWSIGNVLPQWIAIHSPIALAGLFLEAKVIAVLLTLRSVTTVFNVVLELFETYLPAKLIQLKCEGDLEPQRDFIKKTYAFGLSLSFFIGFLFAMYGERLIKISIGEEYSSYWHILLLFWIGNTLYFVGRLSAIVLRVQGGPMHEFIGSVVGSLIVLVIMSTVDNLNVIEITIMLVFTQLAIYLSQIFSSFIVVKNRHEE